MMGSIPPATGTHVHESDSIADRSKYNIELQGQVSDIVKTKRAVPWWVWVIGGVVVLLWFISVAENGKFCVYLHKQSSYKYRTLPKLTDC